MGKKNDYKELDNILANEGIIKAENSENEVAFKDGDSFKNIISNAEFASVIALLTNIVEKITKSVVVRNNAKSKAIDKFNELKEEGAEDEDLSYIVKMIKSELMKTDVKMYEAFEDEFDNLYNSIDFLNRFRSSEEMIEKPNLNWIERVKEYLNNKKEN
mgnify:FL=1|jgi:hypothetical protein